MGQIGGNLWHLSIEDTEEGDPRQLAKFISDLVVYFRWLDLVRMTCGFLYCSSSGPGLGVYSVRVGQGHDSAQLLCNYEVSRVKVL